MLSMHCKYAIIASACKRGALLCALSAKIAENGEQSVNICIAVCEGQRRRHHCCHHMKANDPQWYLHGQNAQTWSIGLDSPPTT